MLSGDVCLLQSWDRNFVGCNSMEGNLKEFASLSRKKAQFCYETCMICQSHSTSKKKVFFYRSKKNVKNTKLIHFYVPATAGKDTWSSGLHCGWHLQFNYTKYNKKTKNKQRINR